MSSAVRRLWGAIGGTISGAFIGLLLLLAIYKFSGWEIAASWITWLAGGGAIGLAIGIIWPTIGDAFGEIVSHILP